MTVNVNVALVGGSHWGTHQSCPAKSNAGSKGSALLSAEEFARRIECAVDVENCITAIDVVEGCSLRCPGCFAAKNRPGIWRTGRPRLIRGEVFRAALAFGRRIGSRHLSFVGGDPGLHPHLPLLIREAIKCGFRVSVTTNGLTSRSRLDAILTSGISGISFSVDGSTPDLHDMIRPSRNGCSTFARTIASLRYAVSLSSIHGYAVTVNHTIYSHNVHDIGNMVRLSSNAGADCARLHFSLPGDLPEPDGAMSIVAPKVWQEVLDSIPNWRKELGIHVEAPPAYGLLDDPAAVRRSPYINVQLDGGILLCAAYTRLPDQSTQVAGWLDRDGRVRVNRSFAWSALGSCKGTCRVMDNMLGSLPPETQKRVSEAGGITCMIASHMREGKSWLRSTTQPTAP